MTTVEINGHTVARLIFDVSEDPRFQDLAGDLARGIGVYSLRSSNGELNGEISGWYPDARIPNWVKSFKAISERHDYKVALRAMNILRALGAELPAYIGVEEDHSPSDPFQWNEDVFSGPNEEVARSHYLRVDAWAKGYVVAFALERKCPVTGSWFTAEDETPLYGVYILPSESLEEAVRKAATECFDLDAQPLSEAGERIREREAITRKISEKHERFLLLARAQGYSPSTEVAMDIFGLFRELTATYEAELEDLGEN